MRIQKRRRREGKTDYLSRLKLLKGKLPRLVLRKTNRYVLAQYVTSKEAQDKIELEVSSKKLLKYGWPKEAQGGLKSTTATYLTGILIGKKILSEKKKTPIIDFGMVRKLHKSKVFAFLKGVIDSGVKIKAEEKKEIFPAEDRIEGKHLKHKIPFQEIKSKIEKQ